MLPNTYGQLYQWLKDSLNFRENGENESRWLLEDLGGEKLVLIQDKDISLLDFAKCNEAVERLKEGEPFQYVVGNQDFYGLNFMVSADVLVPRPETEVLVAKAIELGKDNFLNVLDLCTGSGCIIIALAKHLSGKFHAVDISTKALNIAQKNANTNKVKIKFHSGDLFSAVPGYLKFDLITANPPYLTQKEMDVIPQELTFEPSIALFGGEDGLLLCYRLVKDAPEFLKPQGIFLMEIGENQGAAVLDFASKYFNKTEIIKDYCGKDRFLCAEK